MRVMKWKIKNDEIVVLWKEKYKTKLIFKKKVIEVCVVSLLEVCMCLCVFWTTGYFGVCLGAATSRLCGAE